MFFNNAQCDIYIGTGAGKKLMEEISAARKSVKIVSPFLSAQLVEGLIQLHDRGIHVELMTTEEGHGTGSLQRLIQQQVHVDGKARAFRKRLRHLLWIGYGLLVLGALGLWWFFIQQDVNHVLVTLAILVACTAILFVLRYLIRTKKVYSYSYHSLFPVKVIRPVNEFGQRATYLHSKIYIIDDQIAYLGSLNFTRSGTEYNHETRVRLTDSPSVSKIVQEYRYLMDEAHFPEVDFQEWGSYHFLEPKN